MALHLRYIWGGNDGRVAAKMIRVGTFALHEVAQWCDGGGKRARERLKRGLFWMFENGVAVLLLHYLYIAEIASVYRRS